MAVIKHENIVDTLTDGLADKTEVGHSLHREDSNASGSSASSMDDIEGEEVRSNLMSTNVFQLLAALVEHLCILMTSAYYYHHAISYPLFHCGLCIASPLPKRGLIWFTTLART